MLYPIRVGLLAGTAIGSTSLLVAYGLDSSDTMHVLQAVLDTQFWLTTHVQCITAGYLATFFAGFLAIGAIAHRSIYAKTLLSDTPNPEAVEMQRVLMRMTYGTICFATFFSLIGTVLGGLWADDSWGRFWGWDPKENGALMIVIWNAIVLHARWDKIVRERGFALLAIGGNIITAWSWFGTNQLGIGLHSYGFTSGVLMILTWFVFSQLLLIIVGGILTAPWLYGRSTKPIELDSLGRPTGSWE
jgi:ABC-type transport system involved in cytochrome c biogenesis permease subunit